MKKQVLVLALAGMIALSLTGCGSSSSSSSTSTTAAEETEAATEAVETTASNVQLPKKIEMQVPASAGGGTDVAARALSSYINSHSDNNTTVVNNTDGSGVVAMEKVRTGKADDSELLFFHSAMCINTATGVYDHTGHEDFKVIGTAIPTNKGGSVLVTSADNITDIDSFIDAAKAANGNMMIGVGTGASTHIMAGIISKELGIELKYVEAGSDTDKLTTLVSGSIDCTLVNANQAKQYSEAGKVNLIACFSATDEGGRDDLLPDVPSFVELGYDGCVYGNYFYILANREMDDATAQAILALFDAAAKDPDTAAILESVGLGMEFVPYEDAQPMMQAQQESLNAVCEELGLSK